MPLWFYSAGFNVVSDTSALVEEDPLSRASYEQLEAVFPERVILLIDVESNDAFAPESLRILRELGETFRYREGVAEIKSLTHSVMPVRRGFSFGFEPFLPESPMSEAEREAIRELSLTHPLVRNVMVSADNRHALLLVAYEQEFASSSSRKALQKEIEGILSHFGQSGEVTLRALSFPLIEAEVRDSLQRDLLVFIPAALLVLLLILWVSLRSVRLIGFILLNQLVFLSVFPALTRLSGVPLTASSVFLLPLLAGIQLTLLVHVAGSFQRAYNRGEETYQATRSMLEQIFKSCSFAALTTGVGLLSLAASDLHRVQEFGLLGALGVGLSFLITFGPGLALLPLLFGSSPTAQKADQPLSSSFSGGRAARNIIRSRSLIFGITGGAALIGIPGLALIQPDIRASELLSPGSSSRQALKVLDEAYGGIHFFRLELDSGTHGGVDSASFLDYTWQVQEYAAARAEVSATYSYPLVLAMMNQVWAGGSPASLALPGNTLLRNLFITALLGADFPLLSEFRDPTGQKTYLIIRAPEMAADQYLAAIREISTFAEKTKPEGTVVAEVEGIHTLLKADRQVVSEQIRSAAMTLLAIGLLLAILWRSLRLVLAALLVVALPVGLILGAGGYAGIGLNSITLMVAAVVLGIAVDDAVHFITYWRQARLRSHDFTGSLQETLKTKGPPIICTSLIMIAIFSLFTLASFPPVIDFGALAALAFALTLGAVLCFLPCLLPTAPPLIREKLDPRRRPPYQAEKKS